VREKNKKVEKTSHLQITKNFDIIITETNKKAKKERGGYYDEA
jgi:hypothetical protein